MICHNYAVIDDDSCSTDYYYSAPDYYGAGDPSMTGVGFLGVGGSGESAQHDWSWPCLPSECLP